MATKRYSVNNLTEHGIILDVDPALLPPNAWSGGWNIRFDDASAYKFTGSSTIFSPTITSLNFLFPTIKWVSGTGTKTWIYANDDKVYHSPDAGTTETNITRQSGGVDVDYTKAGDDLWSACVCQNVTYLNNPADSPQGWTGAVKLENLRWDASYTWDDKGYLTNTLRSHKNFLIALQLDKDDGYGMNPSLVTWSAPAEPWTVPTTWDPSDTHNIAGEQELSVTPGSIVDGRSLRDTFMVYKNDSVYTMDFIGGQYIWQFRDVSRHTGLLSKSGVGEYLGKHVFFAQDDIIETDGNSFVSAVTRKIRKKIFAEIDATYYYKAHVVPFHNREELWFCYPSTGNTACNRAAILKYTTGAWTFRDLNAIERLAAGEMFTTPQLWSSDDAAWSSDSSLWSTSYDTPASASLLGAQAAAIVLMNTGYTEQETSMTAYLERTGIALEQSHTICRATAVYVRGTGTWNIHVGAKLNPDDAYTWEGPYALDLDVDSQIRCRVTGRYHAIRFTAVGDVAASLQSYDIEYVETGYGR